MKQEYIEILKKSSVLLVEDNTELRLKFARILQIYIDVIYHASNGREALSLFERHKPSLVITDIEIPIIDGLELIYKIRQTDTQIPIIITTAYSKKEYLFTAIKLNLIDYLVKPIEFDKLTNALQSAAKIIIKNTFAEVSYINDCIYYPETKIFEFPNNISVKLSKIESIILETLLSSKGKVVYKETLEHNVYQDYIASESSLKNIVYKLRKKIGDGIIETIGKDGYKLIN